MFRRISPRSLVHSCLINHLIEHTQSIIRGGPAAGVRPLGSEHATDYRYIDVFAVVPGVPSGEYEPNFFNQPSTEPGTGPNYPTTRVTAHATKHPSAYQVLHSRLYCGPPRSNQCAPCLLSCCLSRSCPQVTTRTGGLGAWSVRSSTNHRLTSVQRIYPKPCTSRG